MSGIMIAAPRSGSGKTMVTCGLLAVFKKMGLGPGAFKCGPDYIDGLFHRKVLEVESRNLDLFFETPEQMRDRFSRCGSGKFAVVEGAMGYFDGLGGVSLEASAWEVADTLGLPVILVVDARGASLSLAAEIQGILEFDTGEGRKDEGRGNTGGEAGIEGTTKAESAREWAAGSEAGIKGTIKAENAREWAAGSGAGIKGATGAEAAREWAVGSEAGIEGATEAESAREGAAGAETASNESIPSKAANHHRNHIAGIIFNRISPGLYESLKSVVEARLHVPVVGYVPVMDFLKVDSRHLGLVLPGEIEGLKERMEQMADCLAQSLDIERIVEIGFETGRQGKAGTDIDGPAVSETFRDIGPVSGEKAANLAFISSNERLKKFRLGVAMDEAFCFYYRENLEAMEDAGAELVYFSPLHDKELPPGLGGMILGGGYPENYAGELWQNDSMRRAVAEAAEAGMPIHGECGGYLYLLKELEGADGQTYPMAGVFDGKGYSAGRSSRFGYITVTGNRELPFLEGGGSIKAHEFHYWDCGCSREDFVMTAVKPVGNRSWPCMRTVKETVAGFPHLYYASNPHWVQRFAEKCREFNKL